MAVTWRNNGEKTDEGEYVVDVDAENGTPVQTFRAKTRKDMADQLANAQFAATRTIHTLKSERTPDAARATRKLVPRPLTADERMRLSTEISDPSKFDEVVDRIIESKYGKLGDLVETENERAEREEEERVFHETKKFMAANPDWYNTAKNQQSLFDAIEGGKLEINAKNFGIVWDQLKASGKAELKPAESPAGGEEEEEERPAPTRRPRMADYASGVRESDISNPPPVPRGKKKYTWADVDRMGSKEYERRLKEEPGFMAAMDELGPRP